MNGLYDEFKIALHSVWSRRWLAMAIAWALALLGWLAVATIPNTYESQAKLLVDVNSVLPDGMGADAQAQRKQIDQIRQTLLSSRNLEKVALATGIVPAGASDREKLDAAGMLQKKIKIVAQQDNIFEITSEIGLGGKSDAENAKLASGVVESLIAVFRDEQLRGGRMNAKESLKFLDAQLAEREAALREAEAKRVAFETQNLGVLPGATSASSRLATARSELSQLDTQLVSAQSALAALNGQLASTPATISMPGISSVGGGVARQQLSAAQADLAGMRARGLTDAHPDVIALKNQIGTLQAQAAREPSGGGGGMTTSPNPAYTSLQTIRAEKQATAAALGSRKSQLVAEIAAMTGKLAEEPAAQAEYERLNQGYTALKENYDKLLAQRENIRMRGQAETSTDALRVEIIDPPTKPRTPSKPNRPLYLTLVLLVGLGGGIAAAFAKGQLDATYPTAAKLERSSGLPVIGSITEILSDAQRSDRRKKLVWLGGAGAALAGLFVILLVVEFVQRGSVA
jgi:polysaccharide chain length determinant protein (PEP-CTERM system associated)